MIKQVLPILILLLLISVGCQNEDISPQLSLKFFNPNTESVQLLDRNDDFIVDLPPRDTIFILVNEDFDPNFNAQYKNCIKPINDQFFKHNITILAPGFVTCTGFELLAADNINEAESRVYKRLFENIVLEGQDYLLAQNTSEVIQIGNIDLESKTTLEQAGDFTFDTLALAHYSKMNESDQHVSLSSMNDMTLISKAEVNCFVSKSIGCEYIDNINCTYSKDLIQVSRIGFSKNQAIVTFRIQCCRGFAIFKFSNGNYILEYQRRLC